MVWGDCLSMKKKIFTYIFSAVCGILTAAALTALFAALAFALQMKRDMAGGMAFIAFIAGCFVSGLLCGLIKKRGGLKIGAVCGGVLLILSLSVSVISGNFTGAELAAKTAAALLAGCTGAVIGVNRKSDP